MKNKTEILKRFPPFCVAALARTDTGVGLSYEQISAASGISIRNISRISKMLDWDNVKSGTITAFLRGCNFQEPRKHVDFIRKTRKTGNGWSHLSPIRHRIFEERCMAWRALKK